MIDLRNGDWRVVLADVDQVDAVVTDPPYSKRNVRVLRSGSELRRGVKGVPERAFVIPYREWTERDAQDLAAWCAEHVRWWVVAFGDHIIWRWLEAAFLARGWWVFAPVAWCKPNPPPRMTADGPCCAVEHILVARPRRRLPPERRGHRRGAYYTQVLPAGCCAHGEPRLVGQKPLELIEQVLADYTLPGDVIAEPFCGSGTAFVAAHRLGLDCVGAELDGDTFAQAVKRIERETDPDAWAIARAEAEGQGDLFAGVTP